MLSKAPFVGSRDACLEKQLKDLFRLNALISAAYMQGEEEGKGYFTYSCNKHKPIIRCKGV